MSATDIQPLSDRERLDWLRLIRSENVGPRTFRSLVGHFGSARAALDALPDLARRGGAAAPGRICSEADATRELHAAEVLRAHLVANHEDGYPPRLATIDDAPPLLGILGDEVPVLRPMIGIVGARNASAAGQKFAATLAAELGSAGFVVISGLARGIDQAAHRASLTAGTIAVLAGGLDQVYPPEHVGLLEAIVGAAGGAISEMPLGHVPRARDFPRRNRLISGCAVAVVIVEAAHRSGSLITARFANEQGREVFAVPGSPLDPRCAGSNDLIKQGAMLVTAATDIIDAVEPILARPTAHRIREDDAEAPQTPVTEPGSRDRQRIVALLGPTPVSADDLVRLADIGPAQVRAILLELEVAGRLTRHRGGLVSLL